MNSTRLKLLSGLAIAIPLAGNAQTDTVSLGSNHYNYLETAIAYQSTDWGPYEEETNLTLLASTELFKVLHLHGRYNNGDTKLPRSVQQDSWWTIGIGAHHYLSAATSVLAEIDFHEIKPKGNRPDEHGKEYKIGIRHDVNSRWRLTLAAGIHDAVVDHDSTFIFETIYSPLPQLGLSFRVRDYDKLDLSSYEFGLRYQY